MSEDDPGNPSNAIDTKKIEELEKKHKRCEKDLIYMKKKLEDLKKEYQEVKANIKNDFTLNDQTLEDLEKELEKVSQRAETMLKNGAYGLGYTEVKDDPFVQKIKYRIEVFNESLKEEQQEIDEKYLADIKSKITKIGSKQKECNKLEEEIKELKGTAKPKDPNNKDDNPEGGRRKTKKSKKSRRSTKRR